MGTGDLRLPVFAGHRPGAIATIPDRATPMEPGFTTPSETGRSAITHMHGLRDLNGKMDTPERLRQAHRLLDISRRVSQSDDVTVICGDFNVEPDSETLNLIRQEASRSW